jgi:hypothetical protein
MATRYRVLAKDLTDELHRIVDRRYVPRLGSRLVAHVITALAVENVRTSPVGRPRAGVGAGGVKLPQSRHPGKLRASWRTSSGAPRYANLADRPVYPVPGADVFLAPFESVTAPRRAWLTNDAHSRDTGGSIYSWIVAVLGRVISSRGSWIGSLQAPKGTVRPSITATLSQGRIIAARAGAETMARM